MHQERAFAGKAFMISRKVIIGEFLSSLKRHVHTYVGATFKKKFLSHGLCVGFEIYCFVLGLLEGLMVFFLRHFLFDDSADLSVQRQ